MPLWTRLFTRHDLPLCHKETVAVRLWEPGEQAPPKPPDLRSIRQNAVFQYQKGFNRYLIYGL
jgi:hypothetical protein